MCLTLARLEVPHLHSGCFEELGYVDDQGNDQDRNSEPDPPAADRLSGDGRAVVVRVADGRVPLVGDGHDDEDGRAQDDVGRRVDEDWKGVAVPVEVDVEGPDDAVVQDGEEDEQRVDDREHDLGIVASQKCIFLFLKYHGLRALRQFLLN